MSRHLATGRLHLCSPRLIFRCLISLLRASISSISSTPRNLTTCNQPTSKNIMATPRISTECTLRKIPCEIREEIFELVVIEWMKRAPHHPSRYQTNAGYGEKWGVKEKRSSRCPSLERALIADRSLYREFFAARVKFQSIRVD
jgi:hypothetical protein